MYPLVVNVGVCIPGAGRERNDVFSEGDDAVPGHDCGPCECEGLGLDGLHADGPFGSDLGYVGLQPVPNS